MRIPTMIAVALLGFGIGGGIASAQAPAPSCREQVRSACGQVQPGNGAIRECVSAHLKEFTTDCQQKIAAHQSRVQAHQERVASVKAACSADLKKSCSDVVPGEGRELMCLKAHEPTVSASCAQALSSLPHGRFGGHWAHRGQFGACREERESLCAGVTPGGGRVLACLQTHQSQLSPGCNAALIQRAQRAAVQGEEVPPPEIR